MFIVKTEETAFDGIKVAQACSVYVDVAYWYARRSAGGRSVAQRMHAQHTKQGRPVAFHYASCLFT